MWIIPIFVSGVAAALVAGILLWRYPGQISLIAISIAMAQDCLFPEMPAINAGVSLTLLDLACLVMIGACLVGIARRDAHIKGASPLFMLFGLAIVNLVRGSMENGLRHAANDVRSLLWLVLPPMAIILVRPALHITPQRMAKAFMIAGCAVCVVALCRWAGLLPIPSDMDEGFRDVRRVVGPGYCLVIVQGFLAVLYQQMTRPRKWRIALAALFAIQIFFLQHRSVWIACAAALLWVALRTKQSARRWITVTVALAMLVALIAVVRPTALVQVHTIASSNIAEAEQEDSTWRWRVDGYQDAILHVISSRPSDVVLGLPPGGYDTFLYGVAATHIHNRYVDTAAHYGLVGIGLLIAWLLSVPRAIARWARSFPFENGRPARSGVYLQAALIVEVVFFLAYNGTMTDGAAIGAVWAITATGVSGLLLQSHTERLIPPAPALGMVS